ncbi:hypothetical protein QCA50_018450 [Cerrena zonata]|uniref:Uncharacterized protein n=1 Tax=Cerrena zonata TaxID=2478898 RepID=A0AAW0FB31_9APHY
MEIQEREQHLRLREQEIMESARELERQKRALNDARNGLSVNDTYDRYPITDRAQYESPSSSPINRPQMLQSHSSTHLAVHNHNSGTYVHSNGSRTVMSAGSSPVLPGEHAPYCGCESCSVSQYRARDLSPANRNSRPIEPPIQLRPEKPKGWIRRLSMPVMGNAFSSSSDSKKGISSNQFKDGYRSSLALPDEDGRLRHDLGMTSGYRNRSSVNLSRGR